MTARKNKSILFYKHDHCPKQKELEPENQSNDSTNIPNHPMIPGLPRSTEQSESRTNPNPRRERRTGTIHRPWTPPKHSPRINRSRQQELLQRSRRFVPRRGADTDTDAAAESARRISRPGSEGGSRRAASAAAGFYLGGKLEGAGRSGGGGNHTHERQKGNPHS